MRVQRLKRLLLFGPYIVVLIPIVLCIVLFVLSARQSSEMDNIQEKVTTLSLNQNELIAKVNGINSSIEDLGGKVNSVSEALKAQEEILRSEEEAEEGGSTRTAWPRKVYLTFDDGPSPNTSAILDILKQYNVKGNFFVVGTQSKEMANMYRRILDEGHVLGMHSYSHKYSDIYSSVDAFTADLDKITKLLYDETGVSPKLYRFPAGSRNDVSRVNMDELIEVINSRGITYYDWNIASGDATNPILSADEIIENSLKDIDKYEEVMLLFHDLSNKTTTVEALPSIIEALLEKDIPIVPIDDTTMSIKHNNKQ